MIYRSSTTVQVYETYIVAYVDSEISRYYRSLIPKYIYTFPQKYPAHITIVRKDQEIMPANVGFIQNTLVYFEYDSTINFSDTYVWLNCYSKDIEDIRESLGLPRCRFNSFHITIGNMKNV